MISSEYYTKEKGYRFYVLEEDGKTIREAADVVEWRKWHGTRQQNSGWYEKVEGMWIGTTFFGQQSPNFEPVFWNTSVGPVSCPSPHAIGFEQRWKTYEEAEAGHREIVQKVLNKEIRPLRDHNG